MEQNQVPDLASVLRTLAAFTSPAVDQVPGYTSTPAEQPSAQYYQLSTPSELVKPVDGHPSSDGAPSLQKAREEAVPPMDPRPQPQHRSAVPFLNAASAERPATPLIDPASITEWRQGLRCVNKIAAQTPSFKRVVQHVSPSTAASLPASDCILQMMAEQLKHEQEWYVDERKVPLPWFFR